MTVPDNTTHAPRDDRPEEPRRARLGRIFDEDAELYDRARPGYPPALYDDLAELAGAGRGCRITAVEAGGRMAAVARRKLTYTTADYLELLRTFSPATGIFRRPPGTVCWGASRT